MAERRHRAARAKPGTQPVWRALVAVLSLCAFLLQALVVQTHIHPVAERASAPVLGAAGPAAKIEKLPGTGDSDSCPLCREFVAAGAFVAPPSVAVVLPLTFAALAACWPFQSPEAKRIALGWTSRGPPSA